LQKQAIVSPVQDASPKYQAIDTHHIVYIAAQIHIKIHFSRGRNLTGFTKFHTFCRNTAMLHYKSFCRYPWLADNQIIMSLSQSLTSLGL